MSYEDGKDLVIGGADVPTVIGKGTRIIGTVEVAGDLSVHGEVQGDIICKNKLDITGVINGNITACDAQLHSASIAGDITCTGDLDISENTEVTGNCEGVNVTCEGKIQGDVTASTSASFRPTAVLIGNLSAQELEIKKGAVLKGGINLK